jgi:hypothetical protein
MRAHVESAPPRPGELGADVGEEVEEVLLHALEKDPAARFQSARAFQDALVEAGAPKPRRVTLPPVPESEATLCDGSPLPPEPTRPALDGDRASLAGTVPGLHADALQEGFDPEAPTRIDVEVEPPARGRQLALWIAAAALAAGGALAFNWIVTQGAEPGSPPGIAEPAAAGREEGAQEEPDAAQAAGESATPGAGDAAGGTEPSSQPPSGVPEKPPGWEIVR